MVTPLPQDSHCSDDGSLGTYFSWRPWPSIVVGTVQYAQVLTRPSFWKLFFQLKPEYRNPHSPSLSGSGPAAGRLLLRWPPATPRRTSGMRPPPPLTTIRFYLLCKSAPCWSHNSCACPVMNLLFTDTTQHIVWVTNPVRAGPTSSAGYLASLFSSCCVVLATLTLTMATARKLPTAVCFLHSVLINCVGSW